MEGHRLLASKISSGDGICIGNVLQCYSNNIRQGVDRDNPSAMLIGRRLFSAAEILNLRANLNISFVRLPRSLRAKLSVV